MDDPMSDMRDRLQPTAEPPLGLRCGVCFGDLTTKAGQSLHTLYQDGSLVCRRAISRGHALGWGPQVRDLIKEVRDGWK